MLWTGSCHALEMKINYDLGILLNLTISNGFHVNPSKTKAVTFTLWKSTVLNHDIRIGEYRIVIVSYLKFLGIVIDDKLSFDRHITNSFSKILFILRRLHISLQTIPSFTYEEDFWPLSSIVATQLLLWYFLLLQLAQGKRLNQLFLRLCVMVID